MKRFSLFLLSFLFTLNSAFAVSLDEKIGQMIITGFEGNSVNSFSFKKVLNKIKKGEISGVILFNKNIKDEETLINLNKKILSSSKITPFIAVDNEGGRVQRYDFVQHKSAKEISKLAENEARKHYSNMAKYEKKLKINMNLAPCVDLALDEDSIINKKERSYGKNSDIVSKYAKIFIEEHNKENIITSLKHFPGHGSVKVDTHLGFADATEVYKADEIKPYKNLRNYDKLNMVMVSHIFNSNFDNQYPASLSKKTIKGILKDEIGFKGVVVSDDYDMGAILNNYSLKETVVSAVNSGVNLMIFSGNLKRKNRNVSSKIHKIIKHEIKKGNIKQEDIDNSYIKIMALKSQL